MTCFHLFNIFFFEVEKPEKPRDFRKEFLEELLDIQAKGGKTVKLSPSKHDMSDKDFLVVLAKNAFNFEVIIEEDELEEKVAGLKMGTDGGGEPGPK